MPSAVGAHEAAYTPSCSAACSSARVTPARHAKRRLASFVVEGVHHADLAHC